MNKEIIIPIIVGFAVGIVVMYGIVTASRSLREQNTVSPEPINTQQTTSVPTQSAEPPVTSNQDMTFSVVNPYPNALVSDDNLIIRGFTSQADKVIIMTENSTVLTTPNDKGEFETDIKLIQGSNYLTFFSINPQGQSKRIDQTIIYSTN